MSLAIALAERGLLPDFLIRYGARQLLEGRLKREWKKISDPSAPLQSVLANFTQGPLAVHTQAANDQHYEVPPEFFQLVLGDHLKYSACWYDHPEQTLSEAEQAMLEKSMERAELADGQQILEIGCGWGSLTLAMARRYPQAQITALSNSAPQRRFIEARCAELQLSNVQVITEDLRHFACEQRFDRIVSIECFEHMRNYQELFQRLAGWLRDDGKCFIHVFCHRLLAYPFADESRDDWMARHFFTGGTMPAFDLFPAIDNALTCEEQWAVAGSHYGYTSRAWLNNLDRHKSEVIDLLRKDLGIQGARRQFHRWRLFFIACEECFHFRGGQEWFVGHYRLRHSQAQQQQSAA